MAEAQSSSLKNEDFLEELDREYGPGGPATTTEALASSQTIDTPLGSGPMTGVMIGHDEEVGRDVDDNRTLLGKEADPQQKEPVDQWCGCLSLAFYQRYFQVDTKDIGRRLKGSVLFCLPSSKSFLEEEIGDNPDIYGPFWIATTLIFVLSLVSNFSSWAFFSGEEEWSYDMKLVVTCVSVIYGFAVVVPTLSYMTFRQFKIPVTYPQMLSLYGYSLTIFIPLTLLCLIPNNAAIWLLILVAGLMSSAFLVKALLPQLQQGCPEHAIKILAATGSTNLVLCLIEKLVFFWN